MEHLIKKAIEEFKALTELDLAIISSLNKCLYCTEFFQNIDLNFVSINNFKDYSVLDIYNGYKMILNTNEKECILMAKILKNHLEYILASNLSKSNENNVIKSLILGQVSYEEVYDFLKEVNLNLTQKRVVILIKFVKECEENTLEVLKSILGSAGKDFLFQIDEKNIIILKRFKSNFSYKQLNEYSKELLNTLNTELMLKVYLAYGNFVEDLRFVNKSYEQAKISMEIINIFYFEKEVIGYNFLGVGRLIYELPLEICKNFISENFYKNRIDIEDRELISVINKFFENNLNISETARKLYMHRNSLIYKLEKIQNETGFDIKVFEQALTFKLSLMIEDYLRYSNKKKIK